MPSIIKSFKERTEKMKKILLPILCVLAATLFLAAMPTEAENGIYADTVRLHILANSDGDDDQSLKLALRDDILARYGKTLSAFESVEEAERELSERLTEIKEFSDGKIREYGYGYETQVTLSEEWYETRDYGDFSLPCGYYTSLRIIIGEGEGHNWWCVMFPPLCLDAALSAPAYSAEEELLIRKEYRIKFKILELISEIAR